MKAVSVAVLSALGMITTGVSIYAVTPPGGLRSAVATSAPETKEDSAVATRTLSQFAAGTTLAVEGRLGHAKLLRSANMETFVLLDVRGSDAAAAAKSAPVNLAIVMDRSGSMKGTRLRNAMKAATAAVRQLHDGDTVSVVAFDTKSTIVVPPTEIGPGARERLASDIESIAIGGDTCISCGIEAGIEELSRTTGKVDKMILLSDGDANHGVRDISGFRSLAQVARDRGVAITTIGVDVDYNEKLLAAVSEASEGHHYFVENDAALTRVFEAEADQLTRTVASDAVATIELAPGVELDRVMDRSFRREDRRVVVPLGAFARGEDKTVLLKVRVSSSDERVVPIAHVEVAYRDLVSDAPAKHGGELAAVVTNTAADASDLDPFVADRIQRSATAAALVEASDLFAKGDVDEAKRRLAKQKATLGEASARASSAAPADRKGALDNDFGRQAQAIDEVSKRFSAPGGGGAAPEKTREGKAAVKRSIELESPFSR